MYAINLVACVDADNSQQIKEQLDYLRDTIGAPPLLFAEAKIKEVPESLDEVLRPILNEVVALATLGSLLFDGDFKAEEQEDVEKCGYSDCSFCYP